MRLQIMGWIFVAVLIVTCGAQASVVAASIHPAAAVQAAGVQGYELHQQPDQVSIDLLGDHGRPMGEVVVRFGDAGYRAKLVSPGQEPLALDWNQAKGILQIKEPGTDRVAYSYFDFQAFSWKSEPAFDELVKGRQQDFDLLLGVVTDYDRSRKERGASVLPKLGGCSATGQGSVIVGDAGIVEQAGIGCSGYRCRGTGTGTAKSLCCESATNDANVCCWNSLCIGCCSLLSCDAGCAIGDYICFCGRTGTSCSSL